MSKLPDYNADEDEISDELEFFLSILADARFDRSEFDNALKDFEIEPDDNTASTHRHQ